MVHLLPPEQEHLHLPLTELLRLDEQIPAAGVAMRPLNQAHVQQLAASEMAHWPEILVVQDAHQKTRTPHLTRARPRKATSGHGRPGRSKTRSGAILRRIGTSHQRPGRCLACRSNCLPRC